MNYKRKKSRMQPGGCYCKLEKLLKVPKAKDLDSPAEAKPTPRRKKNRRKWCRGKVGVDHTLKWLSDPDHFSLSMNRKIRREDDYQIHICQTCGKKLGYRTIHIPCGEEHLGWDYGYYFKDRVTSKYVRKPYPCEEKARC